MPHAARRRRPVAGHEDASSLFTVQATHGEQLGHQRLLAAYEPSGMASDISFGFDASWKNAVAVGGAQRNMQVSALTRNAVGPLRHEGRHQAVTLRQPPWRKS